MAERDDTSEKKTTSEERTVDPNTIELDEEWNPDYSGYWDHHGRSKEEYLEYVASGKADGATPPRVRRSEDGGYVLQSDGSHRVAASQELGRPIRVEVVDEAADESEDSEPSDEQEVSM